MAIEGKIKLLGHKYSQAIALYTQVIKLNSENVVYWANRVFAHIKLKEYCSVIEDGAKAIEIVPRCSKGYYRREAAYLAMGSSKMHSRIFNSRGESKAVTKTRYRDRVEELKSIGLSDNIYVVEVQVGEVTDVPGGSENSVKYEDLARFAVQDFNQKQKPCSNSKLLPFYYNSLVSSQITTGLGVLSATILSSVWSTSSELMTST
ncbi:serine/threonine-protein phosphatase T-like isoform X2 [Lycium barbarum]|uniref:serine/threonine-protein phosphatase T-like isoform X2 n=1 Tax=Lycium barbarum TaxID=112863 RepID=UPI00293E967D|nr:serine/threonine-protein phosphatase T-like isoform X2 [Lycium barbarum]XP_060172474.1 serine/threonine-protein phosphatase T-like isoform X2 [Lycium barbarum]XP_060172475.1 serine/threonine-protein phosphatase T-like isoform X2 [Lycium barbarum]